MTTPTPADPRAELRAADCTDPVWLRQLADVAEMRPGSVDTPGALRTAADTIAGLRADLETAREKLAQVRERNQAAWDEIHRRGAQLAEARRNLAKAERWIMNCVRPEDVGADVKTDMLAQLRTASRSSSPDTENSGEHDRCCHDGHRQAPGEHTAAFCDGRHHCVSEGSGEVRDG